MVSKGVLEAALTAEEKAVHQGVVVCASPLESPSLEDWLSSMSQRCVVLVLDQVTDSRNIGAIMRNAWAFETSAIITTHRHCPKENGVMLRAASGASEHIPLIKVVNLARALETLKDAGFALAGMSAEGDAPISALAKEERLAIILGAEGKGLRRLTEEKSRYARANFRLTIEPPRLMFRWRRRLRFSPQGSNSHNKKACIIGAKCFIGRDIRSWRGSIGRAPDL